MVEQFEMESAQRSAVLTLSDTSQRFLGFFRVNQWWYEPIAGNFSTPVAHKFQFLLIEKTDATYSFLLPVNKECQRLCITYKEGSLYICDENERNEGLIQTYDYIHSSAAEPYQCIAQAFSQLRGHKPLTPASHFWDTLGWCTWDAFYKRVNMAGIHQGLRSLREGGHLPGWVIIDDGWQQFDGQLLSAIEPDPEKFLPKLDENIQQLKAEYNIKVGVWHAFLGYWGGLNSHSSWPVHWEFVTNDIRLWPQDETNTQTNIVDKNHIKEWYETYHHYLAMGKIDFVKVDGQAFLEKSLPVTHSLAEFSQAYQLAIKESVNDNFAGQNIHCMSHEPFVLQHATCALWRNSDDYFPHLEDQGNHVKNNIFNNVWSQFIGVPDWDMFQSYHAHSEFHAMARIISGGPVYLSDHPEKHNHTLIEKLVIKGNQLLKPDGIAKPIKQSLFSAYADRNVLLAVHNHANGCDVFGIFNCQPYGEVLSIKIGHKDLPEINHQAFTVYSYASKHSILLQPEDSMKIDLGAQTADILTFFPVINELSLIGIVDKYLSVKTMGMPEYSENKCNVDVLCAGHFYFSYYGNGTPHVFFNEHKLDVSYLAPQAYSVLVESGGEISIVMQP